MKGRGKVNSADGEGERRVSRVSQIPSNIDTDSLGCYWSLRDRLVSNWLVWRAVMFYWMRKTGRLHYTTAGTVV